MASKKTELTELATAVGLFWDPADGFESAIESIDIPGVSRDVWWPAIAQALNGSPADRDLLHTCLDNGRAFRVGVLDGRYPRAVEWTGADTTLWTAEIPRDLTVDGVYFIQAKHDSTCVLNTSPVSLFDLLLAETDTHHHVSWYDEVAPLELRAYYDEVRRATDPNGLPDDYAEVTREDRQRIKTLLKDHLPTEGERDRYNGLSAAVSHRSANHWLMRLSKATPGQRTRMILRMLRVAGGPYWMLGGHGGHPTRLRICDTREWRTRFELRDITADPVNAGQPQVNWSASIIHRDTKDAVQVDGYCEVRWSHGKLQGNPECKVQVSTPLADLPGYDRLNAIGATTRHT